MTTPDALRDAEYIADVSGLSYGGVANLVGPQSSLPAGQSERLKKVQSAAKIAFIDRLLRDLDILIYCELSALYYMDCSIILFAVRAIVQLIFFTPKAPPFDPTRNQPFIGAIFASNLFCMICHNFFTRPEVGEATRGYLHGGLFIDFIGQKAPVSVVRLLSIDFLILAIDVIMLGLVIERVKAADATTVTSTSTDTQDETRRAQDHDSEERGVLRDDASSTPPAYGAVEMGEHSPHDVDAHGPLRTDELLERTELLADPEEGHAHGAKDNHPLDCFASGEAVIMDAGLVNIVRDQWNYSPANAQRRTTPYVPSNETAAFLRRRFGLQVGTDGRVQRVEA